MKKYNMVMAAVFLFWLGCAAVVFSVGVRGNGGEDMRYKTEINQIMTNLVSSGGTGTTAQDLEERAAACDLRKVQYVKAVSFLPAEPARHTETAGKTAPQADPDAGEIQADKLQDFFRNHNGVHSTVYPIVQSGQLAGYLRFDYVPGVENRRILWLAEGGMFLLWLMTSGVLWYVRAKIVKPFHVISDMPYELAKGNLAVEAQESKSRFFGKFVWGIGMLRDALYDAKSRTLALEKEKKLLLLSVSHDIKIPLSTIKLYAKALKEGLYDTEARRTDMAAQIEKHAGEIEAFVKEIVSTASEEIVNIEVADTEFYLRDYVDKIKTYYEPKCRLVMTRFAIGSYENRLLRGDPDRAFEVMENLMENAFKYGDGRQISLDFHEEDYCQVIEIYNTGAPVSDKEMPHLFDSFYRGSNAQGKAGSGLGLYIGRQAMLKMEGDLYAQRTPDGMRFGLVFRT